MLNGVYAGIIDKFERFFDLDDKADILCEAVPDGLSPCHFFINDAFFAQPPECADVYLDGGDALIYIKGYKSGDGGVKVVAQTRFCENLVTLILNGGSPCLIAEGQSTESYPLPREFASASFSEGAVGGYPVLFVGGEGCLAVLSDSGKLIFYNPAAVWNAGENLQIDVPYSTCARLIAHCVFSYDGREMKLVQSKVEENCEITPASLPFAFFESVLYRADCAKYLCGQLKPRAGELAGFLGEFTEVCVPPDKFFAAHLELRAQDKGAAGLVYPIRKNLWEIRYFAVDLKDGLIENIYEVERNRD